MSRNNTGNPIGSGDPRDREDNTKNLDQAINSDNPTWTDRFGNTRKTMAGQTLDFNAAQSSRESQFSADQSSRESAFFASQSDKQARFNAFIAASGYTGTGTGGAIEDYAAGITITEYNQIVRDADGEFWRLSGTTVLPYTTTGAGLPEGGALVSVGDAVLRQELESNAGSNLVTFLQSGSGTVSRSLQSRGRDTISIRDFGIKADGATDDWQAWKDFFTEYAHRTLKIAGSPSTGGGGTIAFSAPAVIDSISGRSLLSKPLVLPSYLDLRLSGVLFDRHPTWDEPHGTYLITSTTLYQADFGGLHFRGVSHCLEIKNQNLDQTVIQISGVRFSGGDHAMRVECQSAIVTIRNFKSDRVPHLLDVFNGDQTILRDGWISQGPLTEDRDATITNRAHLTIDNVLGVPIPHSGNEVAWINNYGRYLDVSKVRFGGEPGSCTMINNFASASLTYPRVPKVVRLTNSATFSVDTRGGTQISCLVRLFSIPNVLIVTGNWGAIDTNRLVEWGSTADQASEISLITDTAILSRYVVFDITNNQFSLSGGFGRFPPNLSNLFDPKRVTSLTSVAVFSSGAAAIDTKKVGIDFDFFVTANPNPEGHISYRSKVSGRVAIVTGFQGGTLKRRLVVMGQQKANGGADFLGEISVTAKFFDGTNYLDEVPGDVPVALPAALIVSGLKPGRELTSNVSARVVDLFGDY